MDQIQKQIDFQSQIKASLGWLSRFRKKLADDLILTHASALAFTSVLSLIPVLALAFFAFSAFGGMEKLQVALNGFVAENLAPAFGDQILGYVISVRDKISPGALGIFGIVGFVASAILMLSKSEFTLNYIWRIKTPRPWLRKVTTYWTVLSLGPVFLGLSLILSSRALVWLEADNGELARLLIFLARLLPYCTTSIFIALILLWLPNKSINKRAAIVAGTITGVVFELAKLAYAAYAVRAIGGSIYGQLAVLPVFLLWIYVTWLILLGGAELCFFLEEYFEGKPAIPFRRKKT